MLIKNKDNRIFRLDDKRNRFTLFTQWKYALRNWYYDDYNAIPPHPSNFTNGYVAIKATDPGQAIVDWGDGNVETFDMVHSSNGYYVASWRSLNIPYSSSNPASLNWFGYDDDGVLITPYDNHHYDDSSSIKRKIVITVTSKNVYSFVTTLNKHISFPMIECETLNELSVNYTGSVHEIPFDRITKMNKLTSLSLAALGNRLQIIPASIFDMTNLVYLSLAEQFDLNNPDSSNLRLIKNLQKLQTLNIDGDNMSTYIKEFNEIPFLRTLVMNSQNNQNIYPDFSEVSEINQSLWELQYMSEGWGGGGRTNWSEQIAGLKLQNLSGIYCRYNPTIDLVLPEYLKEMRSVTYFNMNETLNTQLRSDTFVNNFYDYVTTWDKITMAQIASDGIRNQFYGMSVSMYNAVYGTGMNIRPSGVLQAPSGFIEGSNNGNPTTPLEKVYVLQKNYKQVWVMQP